MCAADRQLEDENPRLCLTEQQASADPKRDISCLFSECSIYWRRVSTARVYALLNISLYVLEYTACNKTPAIVWWQSVFHQTTFYHKAREFQITSLFAHKTITNNKIN